MLPYDHFGWLAGLVSRFMITMTAMILIMIAAMVHLKTYGGIVVSRSVIEMTFYGCLMLAMAIAAVWHLYTDYEEDQRLRPPPRRHV